jgi:hypothetical protein
VSHPRAFPRNVAPGPEDLVLRRLNAPGVFEYSPGNIYGGGAAHTTVTDRPADLRAVSMTSCSSRWRRPPLTLTPAGRSLLRPQPDRADFAAGCSYLQGDTTGRTDHYPVSGINSVGVFPTSGAARRFSARPCFFLGESGLLLPMCGRATVLRDLPLIAPVTLYTCVRRPGQTIPVSDVVATDARRFPQGSGSSRAGHVCD